MCVYRYVNRYVRSMLGLCVLINLSVILLTGNLATIYLGQKNIVDKYFLHLWCFVEDLRRFSSYDCSPDYTYTSIVYVHNGKMYERIHELCIFIFLWLELICCQYAAFNACVGY